jgi:hypothetical protein
VSPSERSCAALETPANTRGGIDLFRRSSDGSTFQLVESSVNISGHVSKPVFAYEHHPVGGEL